MTRGRSVGCFVRRWRRCSQMEIAVGKCDCHISALICVICGLRDSMLRSNARPAQVSRLSAVAHLAIRRGMIARETSKLGIDAPFILGAPKNKTKVPDTFTTAREPAPTAATSQKSSNSRWQWRSMTSPALPGSCGGFQCPTRIRRDAQALLSRGIVKSQ
jgi:hypothetical protein